MAPLHPLMQNMDIFMSNTMNSQRNFVRFITNCINPTLELNQKYIRGAWGRGVNNGFSQQKLLLYT